MSQKPYNLGSTSIILQNQLLPSIFGFGPIALIIWVSIHIPLEAWHSDVAVFEQFPLALKRGILTNLQIRNKPEPTRERHLANASGVMAAKRMK